MKQLFKKLIEQASALLKPWAKTVWIVYLRILTPFDSAETRREGGTLREYGVFTHRDHALAVSDRLRELGDGGLRRLKIIKPTWSVSSVTVSHPFAVDNYENIIKKLGK